VVALIVLLVLFAGGLMLMFLAVAIAIGVGSSSSSAGTGPTTTSPVATAEPTAIPTGQTGLPARTAVDPTLFDSTARRDYVMNGCLEPKVEPSEARGYYSLYYRGHGTARRLRGKVALVHMRIMSPFAVWTMRQSADVDRAALLAAQFFKDQAASFGLTDLDYVPMTWSLSTDYVPPTLAPDETNKLSNAASRDLVANALQASETSIGQTAEAIATKLKTEGYDEVAFLLHLPMKSSAREFAFPAPLHGEVDVAVVFAHPDLGNLAFSTTHEALHLFGADDIYPISRRSEDDEHDMMRDYCRGFGDARIGAMTAYAIGWTDTPPERPYLIR
jgi:hypothetical protein